MVLMIENIALAVAAAAESSQHIDRRLLIDGVLIVQFPQVLKPRFIHNFSANHLRVADLQRVFGTFFVIALRRQIELANTHVILRVAIVLVANGQGVVLARRIVQPGRDVGPMPGEWDSFDYGYFGQSSRIERNSIDGGKVVDIAVLGVEKERRLLVDGTTDVAAELRGMIAGLVGTTK